MPTALTPDVMNTPELPDSKRLKILITGGAGFVGSHLVDALMQQGHEVVVLERSHDDNFLHCDQRVTHKHGRCGGECPVGRANNQIPFKQESDLE